MLSVMDNRSHLIHDLPLPSHGDLILVLILAHPVLVYIILFPIFTLVLNYTEAHVYEQLAQSHHLAATGIRTCIRLAASPMP